MMSESINHNHSSRNDSKTSCETVHITRIRYIPTLITYITGVGSGGYAGDLTPPTIYVEGILICISPPPRKTQYRKPCKLYATRSEMLGKAI